MARALWRAQGKALGVAQIVVRVHGSSGLDQLSYEDMYYGVHDSMTSGSAIDRSAGSGW